MENKRLRKSKTVKSKDMSILAERATVKIGEEIRKQQIEVLKIPQAFEKECTNINRSGYEAMRISHNMQEYFAAIAGRSL